MRHKASLLFLGALPIFNEMLRIQFRKLQQEEINQNQVKLSRKQAKLYDDITQLILQAFEQIGFKGPVYINFLQGDDDKFNAFCGAFWDHGQRAASVDILLPKNKKISLREIYAVAGHEAVHAKHEHLLLGDLAIVGTTIALHKVGNKIFKQASSHAKARDLEVWNDDFQRSEAKSLAQTLMIGIAAFSIAQFLNKGLYSRVFEKDADITSVKKLGTAFDLITLFEKLPEADENFFQKITADHPSHKTRVDYLSRYLPSNATLFQPHKRHAFVQEELCLGPRMPRR